MQRCATRLANDIARAANWLHQQLNPSTGRCSTAGCYFVNGVYGFGVGLAVGSTAVGASAALDTLVGAGAAGDVGAETTTVYRAVTQTELGDIQATGTYNPSPYGGEGKYFYPTSEQAYGFANSSFGGQAYTVTSSDVPTSVVNGWYTDYAAGEGQYYFAPKSALPLGPVNILP